MNTINIESMIKYKNFILDGIKTPNNNRAGRDSSLKGLIKNNRKFSSFIKDYNELISSPSFKDPNENGYPLIKNKTIVPLLKAVFNHDRNRLRRPHREKGFHFGGKVVYTSILSHSNINRNNNNKIIEEKEDQNKVLEPIYPLLGKKQNIKFNSNTNTIGEKDFFQTTVPLSTQRVGTIQPDDLGGSISKDKYKKNVLSANDSFSSNNNILSDSRNKVKTTIDNYLFSDNKSISEERDNKKKKIKNQKNFCNKRPFSVYKVVLKKKISLAINEPNLLLQLMLVGQENSYKNLIYDEKIIFNRVSHYNKFLWKMIEKLKTSNNSNIENSEKYYEKKITSKRLMECSTKFKEFIFKLTSITVEFYKLNQNTNEICPDINSNKNNDYNQSSFKFTIPFELVPLFYLDNMKHVDYLLIGLFYYDLKDKSFKMRLEELTHILNNYSEFDKNNIININFDSGLASFGSFLEVDSYDYKFVSNKREFTEESENYQSENNHENTNNIIRKNYKEIWNTKEILWLTPLNKYKVIIRVPTIEVVMGDITVKKNLDAELIFFLLEINFQKWDFYLLKHLISLKSFRFIIKNMFSKIHGPIERALSQYNVRNINNSTLMNYKREKKTDTCIINISKEKKKSYGINYKKFFFIYSDEKRNYFKILHNYCVYARNKKVNKFIEFRFQFNFEQMKTLTLISKRQNLALFIPKLITTHTEEMKIKFNYNILNRYKEEDNKLLIERKPDIQSTSPICPSSGRRYGNSLCVYFPKVETIEYYSKNDPDYNNTCFYSDIKEKNLYIDYDVLCKICDEEEIDSWPEILMKNPLNENKNTLIKSMSFDYTKFRHSKCSEKKGTYLINSNKNEAIKSSFGGGTFQMKYKKFKK